MPAVYCIENRIQFVFFSRSQFSLFPEFIEQPSTCAPSASDRVQSIRIEIELMVCLCDCRWIVLRIYLKLLRMMQTLVCLPISTVIQDRRSHRLEFSSIRFCLFVQTYNWDFCVNWASQLNVHTYRSYWCRSCLRQVKGPMKWRFFCGELCH